MSTGRFSRLPIGLVGDPSSPPTGLELVGEELAAELGTDISNEATPGLQDVIDLLSLELMEVDGYELRNEFSKIWWTV